MRADVSIRVISFINYIGISLFVNRKLCTNCVMYELFYYYIIVLCYIILLLYELLRGTNYFTEVNCMNCFVDELRKLFYSIIYYK